MHLKDYLHLHHMVLTEMLSEETLNWKKGESNSQAIFLKSVILMHLNNGVRVYE